MARLMLAALLLGFSASAWADPFTLTALALASGGFTFAAVAVTVLGALYNSSEVRRKAAARADAQRAAYNASLQDRNVTVLRNDAPWQVVYGSPAPVGGALQALLTSGARDEYKHLVIVFAAHECEAIDEIYIEGDPLGTLDANGWVQTGSAFFEDRTETITENLAFVSGVATASHAADAVISATRMESDGSYSSYTVTANGTTTLTLVAAADQTLSVTYSYASGTARVNAQKHLSPGGVDTADAFLMAAAPAEWTAAHKLSGHSYIVLTLDLNLARFQGSPPNVTAKIKGKKVYDYRQPLSGLLDPGSYNVTAPYITAFSRAGTATYIGSDGLLKTAAVDEPRFQCSGPWAVNYLSGSDCTLANGNVYSGVANAAPISSLFTSSIQFGDNTVIRYYYKTGFNYLVGRSYKLSVFLKMDDGGVPVPSSSSSAGDFSFVMNSLVAAPPFDVVDMGGGVYRVAARFTATGSGVNTGIVKYSTQSARGFRVTGYMLDDGLTLNAYIPSVTGPVFQALPSAVEQLLVEAEATNRLTYSEQFDNAAWPKTNLSVTANATTSPDGATTADKLIPTTTSGLHYYYRGIGAVAAGRYTYSIFAKEGELKKFTFYFDEVGGNASTTVTFAGGVPTNTTPTSAGYYSNAAVTITPPPSSGGMYRITLSADYSGAGSMYVALLLFNAAGTTTSFAGDGVQGIYVWGGMHNDGNPTSYIPTTTTAVTRAADVCTVTNTIYSTNNALCVADFLRADYGFAAAAGQVDSAGAIAAANACDSQGFSCHGALSTDASRDSNLLALEESMAGNTHWSGGVWRILAGAWTSPVMDLTDADLAAPIEVTQTANTRATRYNGVRGTYAPAAQLGVVTDYTPYTVPAYVTADGASQWLNASYGFTGTNAQCQKLAAIAVERARAGLTIVYPAHLRAWKLQPGDRVTVTNPELGFAAKTFRVVDWTHLNNAPLALVLTEDVAAMYTGTFSDADPLAPTSTLTDPWASPAAPGAFAAASGTAQLLVNGDGTITTRVLCTWTATILRTVLQGGYSQIQWRLATATDDQWISADMAPDAASTYLTGVQDGTVILVRVRFITGVGAQGNWATIAHTVIGKTAAPEPFDVFTLLVQPDGTRQFNFGYTTTAKPADWQGAEIRYIPGTSATPAWDNMTPLQDSATFYTSSPIELNSPLAGTWTFACKSIDTSGNKSTYKVVNIDLPDRRLGNVFDEFFEDAEGWLGTKTSCHVQDGYLVADDSTTWDTLPATWDAWTRWVVTPASPIYYETPARDFGTVISGQLNTAVDADGTVTQELATSADGATWSAWSSASAPFASRYLKVRLTVAATVPAPIPLVRSFSYQINAPMRSEYINDVVISTLTGFYRTGVGDIRIPMQGVYSVLKRINVVIQDSSAGTWTWVVIDKTLTYGPRIQFRLNGTLADPAYVDFFIEGY